MSTETLANELEKMQADANRGRGVSCVQTMVAYLRQDNFRSACAVARNESDKLWQYPAIRKYIHYNLTPIGYQEEDGTFVRGY